MFNTKYLGVFLESSVKFKCSFAKKKAGFYKAFNNMFGENWTQCFRGSFLCTD